MAADEDAGYVSQSCEAPVTRHGPQHEQALCLPKTQLEHNGDAVRRGPARWTGHENGAIQDRRPANVALVS